LVGNYPLSGLRELSAFGSRELSALAEIPDLAETPDLAGTPVSDKNNLLTCHFSGFIKIIKYS